MNLRLRKPPRSGPTQGRGGVAPPDPRELELFREEIYRLLSRVGERTLDLGSIAAGAVSTLTVAVPGAKPGNTVTIGAPAALDAGLLWCGAVSANDEVTIRVYNPTGSPIDPASATWTVRVME